MWGVWPKLFEAKTVMDGWCFEFKTCAFVWVKTNKRMNPDQASFFPTDSFNSFWGMGWWTRANTEFCLLGTRGKPKRESAVDGSYEYEDLKTIPKQRHDLMPVGLGFESGLVRNCLKAIYFFGLFFILLYCLIRY